MTKTEKLDELFDRWVKEISELAGKFHKDGIINESIYERQKTKLLFITKEPNDPNQTEGDFREWWSQSIKYSFSHRICEWAFGLQKGFPPVTELRYDNQERTAIMKSIAFMNLKKNGGASTANHDVIKDTILKQQRLILEEINVIEPDIIIGGIGDIMFWKLLFPEIEFKDSGFDIKVARVDSLKLINFYHPSYQVPRAMTYCLLHSVFTSNIFTNL